MDSKTLSPSPDNADAKAAFRKPSNDAANRKYRRRSPVSGSSSSDGSPRRERSSSPIYSRDNPARDSESRRMNDNRRDLDKDSARSHRARSGDSYRNSDRHTSRSSNYHRRDDYNRHEKLRDDTRRESEHYRSRDPSRGDDKYSRNRSDGSGYRSRDKDKGDGDSRDEKRDYRNDSTSRRDGVKHRSKEASYSDPREHDGQKYTKEEKKKCDDRVTSRPKDRYDREPLEQFEDKSDFARESQEYSAKKPKLVSSSTDHGKVSKFITGADERLPSSSKDAQENVGKVTSEEAPAKGSEVANDFDAAKIAAMKAAELVNKNLIGTGYMSTDQKKKLLWGNKKNTTAEETGHRWDATLFPDRERQEKFNKLMGVKGDVKATEHKPEKQETSGLQAEKQMEQLQLDLEKQYTAGLRRRDGRTVGLGL